MADCYDPAHASVRISYINHLLIKRLRVYKRAVIFIACK